MDSGKLEREMGYMRWFFSSWAARYGSDGPMGALAMWLGSEPLELHGFENAVATHGVNTRTEWFLKQRCDLVLAYFAARLHGSLEVAPDTTGELAETPEAAAADAEQARGLGVVPGPFNAESAVAISLARRLLHVDGQDLVRYRPREIADLLVPEITGYTTRPLTSHEAETHLADIQAALDLGYDWCLRLARPALQKALDAVRERIVHERHCPPEIASMIAEHSDLGTLTLLAERQRHSLGELY